jgi:ferredoxin
MKVFLDPIKCSGYGACADICPSLFAIDEFGFAQLLSDGVVAASDEDSARNAAVSCAENAIKIEG